MIGYRCFRTCTSSGIVIAWCCGFEFVISHAEHSRPGVETLSWLFQCVRDIALPVIVRAPAFEGQWPTRYLDLGA